MDRHVKVKGQPNLVRDKRTGAVLNINTKSIEDARAAKAQRQKQSQRLDNLENKIERIEQLLMQLVEKNG